MWYDVLVVGVLLFAVIRGAAKGIVWQLATIAALVLCFAFAESFSLAIAPYITLNPPLNRWVAMFGIYIAFSFVCFGLARWLKSWIDKAQFVEYDRHLGSIFGFVKGVIFVLVMTFFGVTLTQKMPEARDAIFHSHTGRLAAVVMDRLHPVMPKELHDVVEPYIHSLDRPDLDLHAHEDEEHGAESDHENEHSDEGNSLEPIEAPPFPSPPRRSGDEAPPFDSVTEEERERSRELGESDFFDLLFPGPSQTDSSETSPNRPRIGEGEEAKQLRAQREKLLDEVADVLAEETAAKRAIVDEIESSLSGLPDQIKFSVVKDWYTDLIVYDPDADPDPKTDVSTPFDQRIRRQLQLHNVPLSSLSAAWQDRLRK